VLVKCGKFRLPSQRLLYQPGWEESLVVDVGEMQIERPKKSQKRYGEWQAEMPHDEVAVVSELGNRRLFVQRSLRAELTTSSYQAQSSAVCRIAVLSRPEAIRGFAKLPDGVYPTHKPRKQALPDAENNTTEH